MTASSDQAYSDDIDSFDEQSERPVAYRSPVMSRLSGPGKLTLDLLRQEVPLFQSGRRAEETLASPDADRLTDDELDELRRAIVVGEQAKERLVLAGFPLIKHLAQKEHARRQNWQSQVTFEDLFQEGVSGLIRGLRAYKADSAQRSATNYLGQWIVVEMRRNVEGIDNDFGVAFDKAERFRKIRALRSRLTSELGREPTDEEIIEAAADPMFRGGAKMGRVNRAEPSARSQLTVSQIAEERDLRHRVGHTARYQSSTSDEDGHPGQPREDAGRSLHTDHMSMDPSEDVVDQGAREGLSRLLQETLTLMGLPDLQRDMIARRYGLPPHEAEQSGRDISRALHVHRERVSKVVEAFNEEMSRPGGAFHRACSTLQPEDLADLNLTWVGSVLGDWATVPAGAKTARLPEVLTETVTLRRGAPAPPEQPVGNRPPHVRAQFICDYHGADFVGVYPTRGDVPRTRACPQCGQSSPLARVMAA